MRFPFRRTRLGGKVALETKTIGHVISLSEKGNMPARLLISQDARASCEAVAVSSVAVARFFRARLLPGCQALVFTRLRHFPVALHAVAIERGAHQ